MNECCEEPVGGSKEQRMRALQELLAQPDGLVEVLAEMVGESGRLMQRVVDLEQEVARLSGAPRAH